MKTLCKLLKKDILKKDFDKYAALVADPKYICKNCGRAANKRERLCKPRLVEKTNKTQ